MHFTLSDAFQLFKDLISLYESNVNNLVDFAGNETHSTGVHQIQLLLEGTDVIDEIYDVSYVCWIASDVESIPSAKSVIEEICYARTELKSSCCTKNALGNVWS